MPEVTVECEVTAPIERVWEAVTDIERYPETMSNVRSAEVVEVIDKHRRHCAWSVMLKGSILEWQEVEQLDPERYVVEFVQLSGDMAIFEGSWELRALGPDLTATRFGVRFEIGIPLLAEMLNPVAERSLHENCEEMLRGVEQEALAQ